MRGGVGGKRGDTPSLRSRLITVGWSVLFCWEVFTEGVRSEVVLSVQGLGLIYCLSKVGDSMLQSPLWSRRGPENPTIQYLKLNWLHPSKHHPCCQLNTTCQVSLPSNATLSPRRGKRPVNSHPFPLVS